METLHLPTINPHLRGYRIFHTILINTWVNFNCPGHFSIMEQYNIEIHYTSMFPQENQTHKGVKAQRATATKIQKGCCNTVYSRYIAVGGVQAMLPRYKWERDISGDCHEPKSGSIFPCVVSYDRAYVCLVANSARRQRI